MRPFLILIATFTLAACTMFAPTPAESAPIEAEQPTQTKPLLASTGDMCGGIGGITCAEGDFCLKEDLACTQMTDSAGTCTAISQICTREYRPVCGCNGKTYSNRCTAHAAGVSVGSNGPCKG